MSLNSLGDVLPATGREHMYKQQFLNDVILGLSSSCKHLDSKYFYDKTGDDLFKRIMHMPEYYLTGCELEILQLQSEAIISKVKSQLSSFDIIELGAGDAYKSKFLLQEMVDQDIEFTYYPVDISGSILDELEMKLPQAVPGLKMRGLHGEYLKMLRQATSLSNRKKLVLFLGANIGNFEPDAARDFMYQLRCNLRPGDMVLTGFDLKKDPAIILSAYNDQQGITRAFNFNLLHRINRELGADFQVSRFSHRPAYNEHTGACKSYLVSNKEHLVNIGEEHTFRFLKDEPVYMEISQKYSQDEILRLSQDAGYVYVTDFTDQQGWFTDHLWKA